MNLNLNFQNSNSPIMEQLIFFHDHSMLIMILIINLVFYLMISMLFNKNNNYFLLSGQMIEIIWTIIPSIILLFIAFPSLKLLYLLEENNKPFISMKTIGNQWYWKYEYSNFNLNFDSYMINQNEMKNFMIRLLETDNRIILPFNFMIRMLISASDVLHSWTIPSLGIKIDAIPGRLNQLNFYINNSKIYFGQCSEICGANHSFMPITMETISMKYFMKWLNLNK
uniref:Cytochrome c oxidase subunit 2 n=1 Tax=Diptera sp. 53 LC-2017 TaxID=2030330 RepID=A0A2D1CPZ6_9DIPT|nr:cytochrome c oxidase subunit 2 [Diptera sp. 53 LC-2017]